MKSTMQEFREFIMKGNIIDMAVLKWVFLCKVYNQIADIAAAK